MRSLFSTDGGETWSHPVVVDQERSFPEEQRDSSVERGTDVANVLHSEWIF